MEQALGKDMNVQLVLENNDSLVKHLAAARINSRNHAPAYAVTYSLLKAVLKEEWHSFSVVKKNRLIHVPCTRVWNPYKAEGQRTNQSTKGAAQAVNDEELTYLLKQDAASSNSVLNVLVCQVYSSEILFLGGQRISSGGK